jgi:hypothetical protein
MWALLLGGALLLLAPFGVAPHVPDGGSPPPGLLLDGPGVEVLSAADAADVASHFPLGERLVYSVSYYGVPIGSAEVEVARLVEFEKRRYAHLVATARTNEFFSAFYRVDDRHEAWIDLAERRVARTRTRTVHGSRESHEEVSFDWETHFLLEHEVKYQKAKEYHVAFDFGPYVFDVIDAFYALRSLPAEVGFEASFPVYASEKVYGLHLSVTKRRSLRHPLLGEVEALEVQPYETVDGEGDGAGAGRLVVLAERGHLPILMSGWFRASKRVRVGGMRAELSALESGDSAWPPASTKPWAPPPRAETRGKGRIPEWEPPAAVLAARERTGVEPRDEKVPWLRAVGAGGEGAP